MIAGILKIIELIFPFAVKYFTGKKDQIDLFIEQQDRLEIICNEINKHIDCDRINIIKFHNGTIDAAGDHMNKASCKFELAKEGIDNVLCTFTDVPLESLRGIVSALKTHSSIKIEDVDQKYLDNKNKQIYHQQIYAHMCLNNIKSMYSYAFFGKNKKNMIGGISFNYINEKTPLSSQHFHAINIGVSQIQELLTKDK
jgi:hypothetical protein